MNALRIFMALGVLGAFAAAFFGSMPIDKATLLVITQIFMLLYVQHDAK